MVVREHEKNQSIRHASEIIRAAESGVVFSGAGISTPSGIPDFRSPGSGLWTRYDPMEVGSLTAFRHHPEEFYEWFRPLARTISEAEPNPAHYAVAQLQKAGNIQTVITQNIDGLHWRSGSTSILEVHGTLQTMTCTCCYSKYPSSDFLDPYINNGLIPHCPICSHILKPDVILFEEQLPHDIWRSAKYACQNCDVILVIGSSLEVVPAANLPYLAVENRAHLIIINEMETYLDERADIILHGDVAECLPLIAHEVTDE